DELGDGAAANLADAHDLVADRVEDGLDPAVEGLVATDQDGQLARACPRHAPADRGVQDADPPLRVYIMNAADERRRAGGEIHVDGAARRALQDAARPQRHALDLARTGQRREDDVAGLSHRLR